MFVFRVSLIPDIEFYTNPCAGKYNTPALLNLNGQKILHSFALHKPIVYKSLQPTTIENIAGTLLMKKHLLQRKVLRHSSKNEHTTVDVQCL